MREALKSHKRIRNQAIIDEMLPRIDPTLVVNRRWVRKAECVKDDVYKEDFYVQDTEGIVSIRAKREKVSPICGRCAVFDACLTDAILHGKPADIRASLTPTEQESVQGAYKVLTKV